MHTQAERAAKVLYLPMARDNIPFPLLRTKLHRPPVAMDHLHRKHLLDRLNSRIDRPLTLVSAPAGYGKSTLVSCWLEDVNIPWGWVTLDSSDNDLHQFLSYLLDAVDSIFPAIGKETRAFLDGVGLPALEVLSHTLINELDHIQEKFVLVLDDYHTIKDKRVHDMVADIIRHPPRHLHLVLASRIDPPLPIATLRAEARMTEIRIQDLRFTLEDTTEFLQQFTGAPIEISEAESLMEITEGWVTGLRLAVLSMRHEDDLPRILGSVPRDNRYIMDYIVAEVLSQLPQGVEDYLLKISVLKRFCAPLCEVLDSINGSADARKMSGREFIRFLKETNLFVIPLDNDHRWFRFHHLFQDLLNRRLKRRFSLDDIDLLHKSAGTWFSGKGLIEEALHHFLACGDTQGAIRLIDLHRHDLMNSEQWHRLERLLGVLPLDSAEKAPEILILKAWLSDLDFRIEKLRTYVSQAALLMAEAPPKASPSWTSLRAELDVCNALLHYLDGDAEQTIKHAQQALTGFVLQAHSARGWAQCLLAGGYQMAGQLEKAYTIVRSALQEEAPETATYHSRLLSTLCFVHWIAADLTGLHQGARQLIKLGQKSNLSQSIEFGHYFLGIFHYLRNQLAEAESHLHLVVQDRHKAEMVNYSHSTFALALCNESLGRSEVAADIVENLIEFAMESRRGELLVLCQAFHVELALRQENISKAEKWARNYDPYPFQSGHRFYLPQLTLVKVHLARNTKKSRRQAADLLFRLHDHYSSINNTRFLIEILALQALLHDTFGEEALTFEKLMEALRLASPDKCIRPFLDAGLPMADLLKRLAETDLSIPYVGILLKSFRSEAVSTSELYSSSIPTPSGVPLADSLSKREMEVTTLLARRLSNKEIAETLFVSTDTVKKHLYNIYQKLHVNNRRQAVEKAKALGIL